MPDRKDSVRLTAIAAGWRLRAMEVEKCGARLSGQFLRECAEELESAIAGRQPARTSWFKHEPETRND